MRWRLLFPPRDEATGRQVEPAEHDLNMITSDPQRVAELRRRLTRGGSAHALARWDVWAV